MRAVTRFSGGVGTAVSRCPACGQRLPQPPPSKCPLCDFHFADTRATSADITPYAQAYATGQAGWRRMCDWVWYARWERLKHIALMQRSVASARFARIATLLMAAGLALLQAARYGWHWVASSPFPGATGAFKPAGRGWLHAVGNLWWNPAHTIIVTAISFASAWLLLSLVTWLVRVGVNRAHKPPYRHEWRMTAATDYSLAWCVPLLAASLVASLRLFSTLGVAAGWSWYPSTKGLDRLAGVVAWVAVILWWFWLIRLASTAPGRTRSRVVAFFTVGVPMIAGAAAVGWWFALDRLYGALFEALNMEF